VLVPKPAPAKPSSPCGNSRSGTNGDQTGGCAGQDQAIGGRGEGTLRIFRLGDGAGCSCMGSLALQRYFYGRRVSLARSAGVGQTSDRVRAAVATEAPVGVTFRSLPAFSIVFPRAARASVAVARVRDESERVRCAPPLREDAPPRFCCVGLPLGAATPALPNYFIRVCRPKKACHTTR